MTPNFPVAGLMLAALGVAASGVDITEQNPSIRQFSGEPEASVLLTKRAGANKVDDCLGVSDNAFSAEIGHVRDMLSSECQQQARQYRIHHSDKVYTTWHPSGE
jgi:hypothetical protein